MEPSTTDDLHQKSWSNKVPVRLTLASDNISSPVTVHPIYTLVPRHSYLSTLGSQAWPNFQHVLPALPGQSGTHRSWFDFKGLPLKGALPVGVLYDLVCGAEQQLPWELTIHYTGFPEQLQSSLSSLPPQTTFLNSLKEACYICRGSEGAGAVMKMSGAAQDALWAAIEKCDVAGVRAGLASTRVVPSERPGLLAHVPVRLLVRGAPHLAPGPQAAGSAPAASGLLLATWDETFMTSRPMPATREGGAWATLGHALSQLLPQLFAPSTSNTTPGALLTSEDAGGAAGAGSKGAAGTPQGTGAEAGADAQPAEDHPLAAGPSGPTEQPTSAGSSISGSGGTGPGQGSSAAAAAAAAAVSRGVGALRPDVRVLVSGVSPPLETPLAWLHAHMHSLDYFLYVVVVPQAGTYAA
mmetsp:Transcript_5960/g.13047  ORF Transcript_5960/g.13047 Transcript_5960/m.13047 type:complete len:410 (+) Transcript_5960:27-1256(+)